MKRMGNATNSAESLVMMIYEIDQPADEFLRNEVTEHTRSSGECAYRCLQEIHTYACHGFYVVESEYLNCIMIFKMMHGVVEGNNNSSIAIAWMP